MTLLGMGGLIRSSASAVVDDPFAGMFTMIVQTDNSGTSGADQFTIPTTGSGYNYSTKMQLVGGSTITETSGNTGSVTLTGTDGAGQYKVGISGDFPRIYFNNGGDKLKLLEWQSVGDVVMGEDQGDALYGCSNCTIGPNTTFESVASAVNQFRGSGIQSLPAATFELLTNGWNQFFSSDIQSLPAATFELLTNGRNQFRDSDLQSLPVATFTSLQEGSRQFQSIKFPTEEYSALLIRIEANNPNTEVTFSGGNSKYNAAGQTARNALLARSPAWTITDGGLET